MVTKKKKSSCKKKETQFRCGGAEFIRNLCQPGGDPGSCPPAERASPTQVVEPPEAFLLSREEIANLETKKKNHLKTDYG